MKEITKKTNKLIAFVLLIAFVASCVVAAPSVTVNAAETGTEEPTITKVDNVHQTDASTSTVDVSWDAYLAAPVDKDKLPESNYYYEVHIADTDEAGECKENWSKKASTYDTSTTLYGLDKGKIYYIRVIAKTITIPRTTVTAYYDKKMIVTTTAQGNTPEITSISNTSVSLKWLPTDGADTYQIMGCPVTNGEASLITSTSATETTIENLIPGTSYLFYVLPMKKGISGFETVNKNPHNQISVTTVPVAPDKLTLENNWTWERSINVSWPDSIANGYEVECSNFDGQNVTITDTDKTVFEITSFAKNMYQKVRVRAYIKYNNQKYYSNWSDYSYFCKQQKAISLKQKKKKKVWIPKTKVIWENITGATSYSIYLSKSSQKGYKKVATTSKTNYILKRYNQKKLKTKQRYYVKIVANGYCGGKKITAFDTNNYRSFKLKETNIKKAKKNRKK